MLEQIGQQAKIASRVLAGMKTEEKDRALRIMAEAIVAQEREILAANARDMEAAREKGMNATMLDRLQLTPDRIRGMADGLREVAAMPDPVGRVLDDQTRPNGLHLVKVAVPIGVIAVIYEARM